MSLFLLQPFRRSRRVECLAPRLVPAKSGVALVITLSSIVIQSVGNTAHAAEWRKEANVSVGTIWSDNICLSPTEQDERIAGTARPDVRVQGEGARLRTALAASLEYNSLGDSDITCPQRGGGGFGGGQQFVNRRTWVPSLRLSSDLQLIENWLTLNASAFAGQNPFNPFLPGGNDAINTLQNNNVTYRWQVGATAAHALGEQHEYLLQYAYNEQYNGIGVLGDTQQDVARFDIGRQRDVSRVRYGARGNYTRVRFDEQLTIDPPAELQGGALESELASASIYAELQLSDSWQLNAEYGEDFNDFISASDEIDGTFWDAGFEWTPNARVLVAAGYGERFFGSTPRAEIRYRHKRSELIARYTKGTMFGRDIRGGMGIGGGFGGGLGGFGPFLRPPRDGFDPFEPQPGALPGDPVTGTGGETFLDGGALLNESASVSYRFTGRRTRLGLELRDSQQNQFRTDARIEFRLITATAERDLGPHVSINARVSFRENTGEDPVLGQGLQQLDGWQGGVGLERRLGRGSGTLVTLRYDYTELSQAQGANTFYENRVSLSVRHEFRDRSQ